MSILTIAPPRSRSPHHPPHRRRMRARSRSVALALIAAAAIVVSGLVGPLPAEAATHAAQSAIADSVRRGTLAEDIESGRITVEQLVDSALAARSVPVTDAPVATTPVPTRAEMEREIAAEVEEAKDETAAAAEAGTAASSVLTGPASQDELLDAPGGAASSGPESSGAASSGAASSGDPLRTSASWHSFWHKVKHAFTHWKEIWLAPWLIKALFGGGVSLSIGLFCAIPGLSALACGVFAAAFGLLGPIFSAIKGCIQRGYYIEIPDLKHSHCHR